MAPIQYFIEMATLKDFQLTKCILGFDWSKCICRSSDTLSILGRDLELVLLVLGNICHRVRQLGLWPLVETDPARTLGLTLLNDIANDLGTSIGLWWFPSYADLLLADVCAVEVLGWTRNIWKNSRYMKQSWNCRCMTQSYGTADLRSWNSRCIKQTGNSRFRFYGTADASVMKLNHIPTSSASGTCLFSSVIERWTLKLKVPGSNPDSGNSRKQKVNSKAFEQ
jgi:hypothetical protein